MRRHGILILCFLWCGVSQSKVVLPEGFRLCPNDTNLIKCFGDAANEDYKILENGYAPLGIERLQPVKGQPIHLTVGDQKLGIFVSSQLDDVYYSWILKSYDIKSLDWSKESLETELLFANCTVTSKHSSTGRFFIANVKGEGNFSATMYNTHVNMRQQVSDIIRNGEKYWHINSLDLKVRPKKMVFNFEVIPNKEVNNALVRAINDNWQAVLTPVLPQIEKSLADVIRNAMNSVLDKLPKDQIFLPAKE